jgi:hypothetical protein
MRGSEDDILLTSQGHVDGCAGAVAWVKVLSGWCLLFVLMECPLQFRRVSLRYFEGARYPLQLSK